MSEMGFTRRIGIGMLGCGVLGCLWGSGPEAAAGEIFRYRDSEGVLHFSNAPTDDRFSRVGPDERMSGLGQAPSGDSSSRSPENSGLPGVGRQDSTRENGSVAKPAGERTVRPAMEPAIESGVESLV